MLSEDRISSSYHSAHKNGSRADVCLNPVHVHAHAHAMHTLGGLLAEGQELQESQGVAPSPGGGGGGAPSTRGGGGGGGPGLGDGDALSGYGIEINFNDIIMPSA